MRDMKKTLALMSVGVCLLLVPAPILAHHGTRVSYDTTTSVTVEGVVTGFRYINPHPALIPAFSGKGFYGHHVPQAVIAAGVKLTGATVHFASDDYDQGPILLQRAVPVEASRAWMSPRTIETSSSLRRASSAGVASIPASASCSSRSSAAHSQVWEPAGPRLPWSPP